MKPIYTGRAPEPGNYVQAVLIDPERYNFLLLSGQTAKEGDIKTFDSDQIYLQTSHALEYLLAVIETAGGNIKSFAQLTVWLRKPTTLALKKEMWRKFNLAYVDFFHKYKAASLPARATAFVSDLPLPGAGTLVEIYGIAAVPK